MVHSHMILGMMT